MVVKSPAGRASPHWQMGWLLASRTLYRQGKPLHRVQKFFCLCFQAIKFSIKIHMSFFSIVFIRFALIGTQCNLIQLKIGYVVLKGMKAQNLHY